MVQVGNEFTHVYEPNRRHPTLGGEDRRGIPAVRLDRTTEAASEKICQRLYGNVSTAHRELPSSVPEIVDYTRRSVTIIRQRGRMRLVEISF